MNSYLLIIQGTVDCRAEEPANSLATPVPDFFQAAPKGQKNVALALDYLLG